MEATRAAWVRHPFAGYAIATGAIGAIAAIRLSLTPWVAEGTAFLLFTPVVLVAGVVGGTFPALFATILAAFLGFLLPPDEVPAARIGEPSAFVATCAAIIWMIAGRRASRPRALAGDAQARRLEPDARDLADELGLLIDGAADYAIYMLDPQGHVTIWNKGAERLKGWTEQEVTGQPASIFYPPRDREAGKPAADLEKARLQGKLEEEAWRLRKDGSEFLAHVSITALYDDQGKLRGFGKVIRDVTDQRANERELRASAAHLRSILATVPEAMIVIDEAGMILSFSAAAERLFGYSEDEIVGRNVSVLMPSPDRERHDGYIRNYLATGERRVIGIGRTVAGCKKDGSAFPMELSVGEARADGRQVFTGFVRDLTEQQATEERLEELRSGLVHAARVSAMGTMASTLAHELNQPIAAVANYMEGARDLLAAPSPDDFPMIRDALDEAAKEAMRAGGIVRRLREFIARGEVEKSVEDLPALIEEAAKLGLIGARERGISMSFGLDPAASPVLVDKVQTQQVLLNLMRNAIDAMSECPIRHLTVSTRLEPHGMVRVTVADTGPGVAPEVVANLFKAFNSSKSEGMGLGLSICRTIIEAAGGRIWMEPRQGGGSLFHFTLVRVGKDGSHDG